MGIHRIDGRLQILDEYSLADLAGLPGQSQRMPSSGIEQEWFTPLGASNEFTQLMSGAVIWRGNLTFEITPLTYYILGNYYTNGGGLLVATDSDDTLPRIDVIYADNADGLGVLRGTPATNPSKPTVDPYTQIELTYIFIAANATAPTNVSSIIVYDEDNEWASSSTSPANTSIYFDSTLDPKKNNVSIKISRTGVGGVNNSTLIFENNTTIDILNATLCFYIKTSVVWQSGTKNGIKLHFYNGSTLIATIPLVHGSFGFNGYLDGWQSIAIPIKHVLPNITNNFIINTIVFEFGEWGAAYSTFNIGIDYIELQNGLVITPPLTSVITEDTMFEFRDITGVIGQTYYLDMYAYYGYKIIGAIFQVDGGTTTATVKINNTAVTELNNISITDTPTPITVSNNNTVQVGNSLSFLLQGFTTTPSLVRGKLLVQRT